MHEKEQKDIEISQLTIEAHNSANKHTTEVGKLHKQLNDLQEEVGKTFGKTLRSWIAKCFGRSKQS
jgi:hypothetical protein